MTTPLIHVIFKTHLDIGFTDHATRVRAQYHDRFIPQAIDTATHFWTENPEQPAFVWTTGAWLIHDHLATQDAARVARLEQAIARGLIRWYALPFTTHTELMSPAMFRAGLSFSQELDARFGMSTRAAKMTDVPGHTLGMVPLLAAAGVRFLHLGVNTACPVPDVPELFRWRAPDGSEVVVMYQNTYGATHLPAGFDEGLTFAHTNDNIGPQSVGQTVETWRHLRKSLPQARLVASTLDTYADMVWERRSTLPVITTEIGDSWIHGSASDPVKMARYLALQRLYDGFDAAGISQRQANFGWALTLVAEHTCGIDVKTYLRDEDAWDRLAFEVARRQDYRFVYSAASWAEQRAYMDDAVALLTQADQIVAQECWQEPAPAIAIPSEMTAPLIVDDWTVEVAPDTGDVTSIINPDGISLHCRIGYRHESYDSSDMTGHMDSYILHREDWAVLDHDKPGLDRARTANSACHVPRLVAAKDGMLWLQQDDRARAELGAPDHVTMTVRPLDSRRIELAWTLRAKPANRMPEAGFVEVVVPGQTRWDYLKMGLWHDPGRIAPRGGGQLQAVSAVRTGDLRIDPQDTPLVAPLNWPFMRFSPAPPDLRDGIRFNLYNNKWGTNFPQWWEGDFCARFILTF